MNTYLRIETTTDLHLYRPNEWENWNVGTNFLVVIKPDTRKDMYSLKDIISVQQSESISDFH